MKNNFITKIIGATLAFAMMIGGAVGINAAKQAKEVNAATVTYKLTIDANDFNTTSYAANNNEKTSTAVCTTDNTKTFDVDWTSYQVMKNGDNMQWQKSKGYIYNSTDLGTITNVTVTSSAGTFTTYYGTEAHPTSGTTVGNGYFTVNVGGATGTSSKIEITFDYTEGSVIPTYTVTYHDNNKTSGSVPTDSTRYESGQNITVAGNTGNLARTGYTWSGWSINQDGSGTVYGPNYTTIYTVASANVHFYPKWTKIVTPLPESGTITIDPTVFGNYGTDVAYTVPEDNTPNSEFGFSCTDVTKGTGDNAGKIQFKKSTGSLYNATPLSYIRSITIGGANTSDAVITYGKTADSGCTSTSVGTDNQYFKIVNGNSSNARYWTITISYSLEAPAVLTGLNIESGLNTVRKSYDEGESFDSTGLVIRAEWNNQLDTETNVVNDVVWSPDPLVGGTTEVTGTYTHGDEHETVTVTGLTVKAPDAILNGSSNVPAGVASTTNTNTGEGQVNESGVKYGYYALQTYSSNLEFNQNTNGAYVGNNESFGKYIRKIVVTLGGNYFNRVTMYKGNSAIPSETSVSPEGLSNSNKRTYDFNDDSEYFVLKQVATGNWTVINKIEIFLGSEVPVVDTVSASVTNETRYAGQTLSTSDFELTVTWTQGKADTHPTSGFTWTVNGQANGTLQEGNNSVVVTYAGVNSLPINVVGAHPNARDVIEDTITTSSSLAYHYNKTEDSSTDTLTRELTGISGSGYDSWSNKTDESVAVYAGQSAGGTDQSGATIQLRSSNSNSGIITTTTGGLAQRITVVWNSYTTAGRKLDVYGKNSAYTSPEDLYSNSSSTQGTKLGTIEKGTSTELIIEDNYSYIGLRSSSGAIYIESIEIEWSAVSYAYSNISMRFGGSIDKDLWDELDTNENPIAGVGVLITGYEEQQRSPYSIKDHYAEAINFDEVTNIKTQVGNCYVSLNDFNIPEKNNEYYWNLKYEIASINDMLDSYTAAAYIKLTNGDLVFLKQVKYSVWSLAKDYLDNRNCNEETADGSLHNIVASAGLE